ncbi:hypothetical protein [Hahella sp. CCB-MM4]|uniref:hypothetical protein n=1 Tax=Hahella sp. (strain CCB-MM4) TaxID=1926491 RepID=UPI00143D7EF7|nr:hypothetical protein [Hahella sp. CCB-MM4]
MKVLFAVFSILFSHAVFAGKWVEVKGGVVPLEVDTAILEEKLWEYVAAHSDQNFPP